MTTVGKTAISRDLEDHLQNRLKAVCWDYAKIAKVGEVEPRLITATMIYQLLTGAVAMAKDLDRTHGNFSQRDFHHLVDYVWSKADEVV